MYIRVCACYTNKYLLVLHVYTLRTHYTHTAGGGGRLLRDLLVIRLFSVVNPCRVFV